MTLEQSTLRRVHEIRLKSHGWPQEQIDRAAWPSTEAEWRQTPHGAPWDSHVEMARWLLNCARKLQEEGLL